MFLERINEKILKESPSITEWFPNLNWSKDIIFFDGDKTAVFCTTIFLKRRTHKREMTIMLSY